MQIAFIGAGVMGEVIARSVIEKGVASVESVVASDPELTRRQCISERCGIATWAENRKAIQGADVILLTIKPQTLPYVFHDLAGHIAPDQLVLSIIAGATVHTLCEGLLHASVVRAMPNMPAQIGQGMSLWMATADVTPEQKEQARAILAAMGNEFEVNEEKYLDMATAVSGSGPAYVFLFIEAMIDAAVHIGFSRPMAHDLVMQTVAGSAAYAQRSGKHPADLRNMVTSPGGTTTEALLALECAGFRAALTKAVLAAYDKTRALGGVSSK